MLCPWMLEKHQSTAKTKIKVSDKATTSGDLTRSFVHKYYGFAPGTTILKKIVPWKCD